MAFIVHSSTNAITSMSPHNHLVPPADVNVISYLIIRIYTHATRELADSARPCTNSNGYDITVAKQDDGSYKITMKVCMYASCSHCCGGVICCLFANACADIAHAVNFV